MEWWQIGLLIVAAIIWEILALAWYFRSDSLFPKRKPGETSDVE